MRQTNEITRRMTAEQENHALRERNGTAAITYRLYTEDRANLLTLAGRYFPGFTLINAIGVWEGQTELSKVIEIVTDASIEAQQKIFNLAGDIAQANEQTAVLITWTPGSAFLYRGGQRTSDYYRPEVK